MHRIYLAIIAVLAAVILYFALGKGPSDTDPPVTTPAPSRSVAVLRFVALGDAADALAATLSDEIAVNLTAAPDIVVMVDRSPIPVRESIRATTRRLGTRFALEGAVSQRDGTVRVTAQLVDGDTEAHLWAETYERNPSELPIVAEEIAAVVVRALTR